MHSFPENVVNINSIISESRVVVPLTVEIDNKAGETLRPTNYKKSLRTTVTSDPVASSPRNLLVLQFALVEHPGKYEIGILGRQHISRVTDRLALRQLCSECHALSMLDIFWQVNCSLPSYTNGWCLLRQPRLKHDSDKRHWVDMCAHLKQENTPSILCKQGPNDVRSMSKN